MLYTGPARQYEATSKNKAHKIGNILPVHIAICLERSRSSTTVGTDGLSKVRKTCEGSVYACITDAHTRETDVRNGHVLLQIRHAHEGRMWNLMLNINARKARVKSNKKKQKQKKTPKSGKKTVLKGVWGASYCPIVGPELFWTLIYFLGIGGEKNDQTQPSISSKTPWCMFQTDEASTKPTGTYVVVTFSFLFRAFDSSCHRFFVSIKE